MFHLERLLLRLSWLCLLLQVTFLNVSSGSKRRDQDSASSRRPRMTTAISTANCSTVRLLSSTSSRSARHLRTSSRGHNTDSSNQTNEGRIINGELYKEDAPYIVSLMYKRQKRVMFWKKEVYSHFCGGTILNDNSILTASHCYFMGSKKLNVREIYVYIGHKSVEDPEEEYLYQAEKFHYNEAFTKTFNPMTQMFAFDRGGDVAVLKLKGKINFEHLKGKAEKICLPSPGTKPLSHKCIVMGWGLTREGGTAEDLSTELQYTHVPILPYHTCARLNSMKYDSKTIICAGDLKAEKDACQGDSGGPFLCPTEENQKDFLQFGIVSYGDGCGHKGGFYTKTAEYIDWIRSRAER